MGAALTAKRTGWQVMNLLTDWDTLQPAWDEYVERHPKGTVFHNGEPVTAEDVKFSFERYRGTSKDLLKGRVAAIETPDPHNVRFKLKAPWPEFMTFYATTTGASWIVPKNTSRRSAKTGSRTRPSAPAPIGSSPPRRALMWCSRPSISTGGKRRASNGWCSR